MTGGLARLSAAVVRASGWRRVLIAAFAGAASDLAMAPFHLWPMLLATLAALVWLIDGALDPVESDATPPAGVLRAVWRTPAMRAARVGWWFGFGYFLAGLFWIGEAFLVEAEVFAWLIPFAVTLLPAVLALFYAAAALAASRLWRPGLRRVLALALALAASEWLRGHVLTGFPWNTLGYALTMPLELMQAASWLGIYGLTLLAVVVLAGPLVTAAEAGRRQGGLLRAVALVVVPLFSLYVLGAARLSRPAEIVAGQRVRVVQPAIPQREKWRPENQQRIFDEHLALSAGGGLDGIRLIVWPEAAMPFRPLDQPGALDAIGRLLPDGVRLASGALRVEEAPGRPRRVFNSLIVFGAGGRPMALYDKTHLVPFGEYLPLQTALEAVGLEQLTRLRGGFASGIVPRPLLQIEGLPAMAPLVCYEAIFPAAVVHGAVRPGLLLNVTNDGWFGNTTGPRQHFHQARVRAVEEGLPLVRAANNGISGVVDPFGRVVARIDLDARAAVDAAIPAALAPTVYSRLGDGVFFAIFALLLGALGLDEWRSRLRDRSAVGFTSRER